MTKRRHVQVALAEVVLAAALGEPEDLLDPTLRLIDGLLDDEELVERVYEMLRGRRAQSARRGRYGTPAEVVLRLQVLKHLKGWSFGIGRWPTGAPSRRGRGSAKTRNRSLARLRGAKAAEDRPPFSQRHVARADPARTLPSAARPNP